MYHHKLKASYDHCGALVFANNTGATIEAGTFRVEGGVLGMVMQDVEDGEEGILLVEAPAPGIVVPKEATTVAFSAGDVVYWDVADGELNDDSTNNVAVGYALEDAAAADAEVRIRLLPSGAPVA